MRIIAHRQQNDLANELVDLVGHPRDADAEHRLLLTTAEDRFEVHRCVLQTLEKQIAQTFDQRRNVTAGLHQAMMCADFLAASLQEEQTRLRVVAQAAEQSTDAATIGSRAVLRKELIHQLGGEDFRLSGQLER